jgi:hypothetical protein
VSSPHLFDQAITAQPCKVGCVKHVHAQHLPSAYVGADQLEVGADKPRGWTVQGGPAPAAEDLLWFLCNACEELVSELDVEGHRCAPA